MSGAQLMPSWQIALGLLGILLLMLVLAGLPLAFLFLLLVGPDAALAMGALTGSLVAGWLPLKLLVSRIVHGPSNLLSQLPSATSLPAFFLATLVFLFMIPFLWLTTFPAFIVGVVAYLLSGDNALLAILAALAVQSFRMYRFAQRELASGQRQPFFVMSQSFQGRVTVTGFGSAVQRPNMADDQPARVEYLMDETPDRPEQRNLPIDPEESDAVYRNLDDKH